MGSEMCIRDRLKPVRHPTHFQRPTCRWHVVPSWRQHCGRRRRRRGRCRQKRCALPRLSVDHLPPELGWLRIREALPRRTQRRVRGAEDATRSLEPPHGNAARNTMTLGKVRDTRPHGALRYAHHIPVSCLAILIVWVLLMIELRDVESTEITPDTYRYVRSTLFRGHASACMSKNRA